LKSPMSTLKKCGRLSPLAHGDCLSAAGILGIAHLLDTSSTRRAAAAQRSRQSPAKEARKEAATTGK
jgi:hypothetical protein